MQKRIDAKFFDRFCEENLVTTDGDEFPNFTPSATKVFKSSILVALERGHELVGAEHFLYALRKEEEQGTFKPRVLDWLLKNGAEVNDVVIALKKEPFWDQRQVSSLKGFTPSFCRVLDVLFDLAQIVQRQKEEKDEYIGYYEIPTELLIGAIILEGTSIASEILGYISKGRVNSKTILNFLKVGTTNLLETSLHKEINFKTISCDPRYVALTDENKEWEPDVSQLELGVKPPQTPTSDSSWIIYPQLLIGGNPGNAYPLTLEEELEQLVHKKCGDDLGRNMIIYVQGEFGSEKAFYEKGLPKDLANILSSEETCDTLYYPIRDYEFLQEHELVELVGEIKRKMTMFGSRVYCCGSAGRVGLIVIPLVAALYNLCFEDALEAVNRNYSKSNVALRLCTELPGCKRYFRLARQIVPLVADVPIDEKKTDIEEDENEEKKTDIEEDENDSL